MGCIKSMEHDNNVSSMHETENDTLSRANARYHQMIANKFKDIDELISSLSKINTKYGTFDKWKN